MAKSETHCPSIRRNMRALPPRRVTVLHRSDKNRLKNLTGTQAKVQGLRKGARQLKSRKPLGKTQGQTSFLDRHVRNMENRRGPLNRRIKRYSILQQLIAVMTDPSHLIVSPIGRSGLALEKHPAKRGRGDPTV